MDTLFLYRPIPEEKIPNIIAKATTMVGIPKLSRRTRPRGATRMERRLNAMRIIVHTKTTQIMNPAMAINTATD